MTRADCTRYRDELRAHLSEELLPFWMSRVLDKDNGGYITHFDEHGQDSGEDEKSLIAQSRTLFTMSYAHRFGYGDGRCGEYAEHGLRFLLDRFRDPEHGGLYWMLDRGGRPVITKKILYGQSFAIYALAEYTRATGDRRGVETAADLFDLVQVYCGESAYGGYLEMFERDWRPCPPGAGGGDRKTLDVHMHLMEAFTALYAASNAEIHARKLREIITLLVTRMFTEHGTGIPQFTVDWHVAPQIKFEIVWGWDRFAEGGAKANALDNTSYGHNVEFAWLLREALHQLNDDIEPYKPLIRGALDHAIRYGIDETHGGVYVEGAHDGPATDLAKEFWQQAEVMTGMLDGYSEFNDRRYLEAYTTVHRFVMRRMIHHSTGEWWPLLTREGEPIWRHMSHSWKVNYHTVRAVINCIERLTALLDREML